MWISHYEELHKLIFRASALSSVRIKGIVGCVLIAESSPGQG